MIKHKKDVHNIIWNGGDDVKEKGDAREGSDVIKNRAWHHSNFKERGYDSYFQNMDMCFLAEVVFYKWNPSIMIGIVYINVNDTTVALIDYCHHQD